MTHSITLSQEELAIREAAEVAHAYGMKVGPFRKATKSFPVGAVIGSSDGRRFKFIDRHELRGGRGWWIELPQEIKP